MRGIIIIALLALCMGAGAQIQSRGASTSSLTTGLAGKVDKPVYYATFTNDSIDCSNTGGIIYDSTIISSSITLKSKFNGRQPLGFVQMRLYGDGTHTLSLPTDNSMEYATGQSFDNTTGKKNDITIVFFSQKTYKKYKVFVNN